MRSAKGAALILAGITVVYLLLLGQIGWGLIGSGEPVGVALGVAILVFPILGVWLIARELSFGFRVERLQEQWRAEGRQVPGSDEGEFEQWRAEVERSQHDWHAWFGLGLAYAVAGDKPRARSAMRHADHLFRRRELSEPPRDPS